MGIREEAKNRTAQRNFRILTRFNSGVQLPHIAMEYGLAPQTIRTIVFAQRRLQTNQAETVIARALDLARSGTVANFEALKERLSAEGHNGAIVRLSGRTL